MTVTPLTDCDSCGHSIWADDVFKEVVIPNAEQHLAVVYKCEGCGTIGKAATSREDYKILREATDQLSSRKRKIIEGAKIDIESIESADELIAEFRTYPVQREHLIGKCKCKDCMRRLYEA